MSLLNCRPELFLREESVLISEMVLERGGGGGFPPEWGEKIAILEERIGVLIRRVPSHTGVVSMPTYTRQLRCFNKNFQSIGMMCPGIIPMGLEVSATFVEATELPGVCWH